MLLHNHASGTLKSCRVHANPLPTLAVCVTTAIPACRCIWRTTCMHTPNMQNVLSGGIQSRSHCHLLDYPSHSVKRQPTRAAQIFGPWRGSPTKSRPAYIFIGSQGIPRDRSEDTGQSTSFHHHIGVGASREKGNAGLSVFVSCLFTFHDLRLIEE